MIREAPTEELSASRMRHCTIVMADGAPDPGLEELAGVSNLRADGRVVRFDHHGDVRALIAYLSSIRVEDVLIEPETLLEAFFEVYDEPSETASGEAT